MTFAATANAITYTGAEPVFVDCDSSGNIDPALLETAIRTELSRGSQISAIMPVDLLGKIADYPTIVAVASEYGIPVISDAAESLGAVRNGRPAGSYGNASAISFNGNKIITTSGGGALATDDADLAANTRYLATQARQPVAHYEHHHIGFNYRLSNLLAGIGRAQLRRLPSMLERRMGWRLAYRELAESIHGVEVFGGPDGSDAMSAAEDHDNFWLTSLLVNEQTAGWSAHSLRHHLTSRNIEARPLWKPMHQQPVFASHRRYLSGLSDVYFERGISLPSGSALKDSEFEQVVSTIRDFARSAK
jgi:dTDP-4-amino-4,6-dideoxygalactose transaminase